MKKVCPNCSSEFKPYGNQKYCNRDCGREYRNKPWNHPDNIEVDVEVVDPAPKKIYPIIIEQYGGKAWLRLYRVDTDLATRGRVKLMIKVLTTGRIEISESLTHGTLGSGDLFDDRIPPKRDTTWSGVLFVDAIITQYLSHEGGIKLALLFQQFDDGTSKMKITQMIPREAVPHHNTKVGHGSCRTKQISDVVSWINEVKEKSTINN